MTQNTPMQLADRKPYQAPALIEFGTLTALTQSGTASSPEGGMPTPAKKP
ncbi:lasso RiPP family leader peptide-containing protein [Thermomonas sp. S9]|nr:lasso RiPP family leader peptide-containing protein [Thermomonas sp. S9]MCR6496058.1 lasso RiPP family leader peptide-containing protein [Thermomonas sp. S9]